MMCRDFFCIIVMGAVAALARDGRAGEREWQPMAHAMVALLRPPQTDMGVGYGVGIDAAYGLSESISFVTSVTAATFRNIRGLGTGMTPFHAYSASRIYLLPMLRFATPVAFLPHVLGDLFVPSVSIGAGYVVRYQSDQRLQRRSVIVENLDDTWGADPILAASLGVELRPMSRLAIGITSRYVVPMMKIDSDQIDLSVGVGVSVFLYP